MLLLQAALALGETRHALTLEALRFTFLFGLSPRCFAGSAVIGVGVGVDEPNTFAAPRRCGNRVC